MYRIRQRRTQLRFAVHFAIPFYFLCTGAGYFVVMEVGKSLLNFLPTHILVEKGNDLAIDFRLGICLVIALNFI